MRIDQELALALTGQEAGMARGAPHSTSGYSGGRRRGGRKAQISRTTEGAHHLLDKKLEWAREQLRWVRTYESSSERLGYATCVYRTIGEARGVAEALGLDLVRGSEISALEIELDAAVWPSKEPKP